MVFGWSAFVIPLLFVLSPPLQLIGTRAETGYVTTVPLAGVWLIRAANVGYAAKRATLPQRAVLVVAVELLLMPHEVGANFWPDLVDGPAGKNYPTACIAQEAGAFLAEQAADAPFLLQVSFPDPHHPFTSPGRFADMHDPAEVILPASFEGSLGARNDLPAVLRRAHDKGDADPHCFWPRHVDETAMHRILALNDGSITFIDDAVGQIVKQLEQSGLSQDTIIVFMSDHGDDLGDHGTVLKMGLHDQSVVRVRFIWSDPARSKLRGARALQASAIDFAPTILARAGLKAPIGMQGVDMFGPEGGRPPILIEDPGISVIDDGDAHSAVYSLVDQGWRLSLFEEVHGWGELYDLSADPDELNSLWDEPECAARRAKMVEAMALRLMSLRDQRLSATARA